MTVSRSHSLSAPITSSPSHRLMVLAVLLFPLANGNPRAEETLFPNKALQWQRLEVGAHRLYGLSGLAPQSMYEVKVSFPGTVRAPFVAWTWRKVTEQLEQMPVSVQLEFVETSDAGPSLRRRLLDTEKIIFETPADSAAFCSSSLVRVTAIWNGNSWDKSRKEDPLLFNIVVAPMFLGVPLECLPHAAVVLTIVCAVLCITFRSRPLWPASVLLESFEGEKER